MLLLQSCGCKTSDLGDPCRYHGSNTVRTNKQVEFLDAVGSILDEIAGIR